MKIVSYLLAVTSAAVFIPSAVFAAPVERKVSLAPVNAEPVCFLQADNGHIIDLTAMCSTSGTLSTPEEAETEAELMKAQLEALARSRQSNAGLINRAMQAGMNLAR